MEVSTQELGRWSVQATTGADGAFELRGLPLDPASLTIQVKGAEGWHPRSALAVTSYARPATFVLVRELHDGTAEK